MKKAIFLLMALMGVGAAVMIPASMTLAAEHTCPTDRLSKGDVEEGDGKKSAPGDEKKNSKAASAREGASSDKKKD